VYPGNIPLEPTQPPPLKGGADPLKEDNTQATHLSKREEELQALASKTRIRIGSE
jgi:hypothetical protein